MIHGKRDTNRLVRLGIFAAVGLLALPLGVVAAAPKTGDEVAPTPAAEEKPSADEQGTGGRWHRGGRGGHGAGRREALRLWLSLSDEERAEIRDMLAEEFPERYEEIMQLETAAPDVFGRHLGRMLPELMRLLELRQTDPDAFKARIREKRAEFKLRRLARRYQFAEDDAARAQLETEIHEVVEELFDLRQARAEREIHNLERRLQQLSRRMEDREARRDQYIDRHVEDILAGRLPGPPDGEDDGGGPPSRGPRGRRQGRGVPPGGREAPAQDAPDDQGN